MKQKYVVMLNDETGKLAIQEYAELDKEMLSLLCEETYDAESIKAAIDKDRNTLIQALRTHNMYPPGIYTERIADAIIEMFKPGANTSTELFFEERELFKTNEVELAGDMSGDGDDEDDKSKMEVDDLLEDDIDDDFEEKGIIKDLKKSIKLSDEDTSIDDS